MAGRSCAAMRMAAAPSGASPTTSKPSASSSARAAARKSSWSSTIRTVLVITGDDAPSDKAGTSGLARIGRHGDPSGPARIAAQQDVVPATMCQHRLETYGRSVHSLTNGGTTMRHRRLRVPGPTGRRRFGRRRHGTCAGAVRQGRRRRSARHPSPRLARFSGSPSQAFIDDFTQQVKQASNGSITIEYDMGGLS